MLLFIISLLAGALLPFAFAPFGIYPLAFFAPAVLLYCLIHANRMKAFFLGWLFGIGFFAVGTYWIYISIHNYGNASAPLAGFITAIFVLFMGLYYAVQSFLFRLLFKNKHQAIQCLIAFPALWALFEFIRGWLFTGFPWLFLGYTQGNSWLRGFIPLFGIYGVSLIVAIIAGCFTLLGLRNKNSIKFIGVIILVCIFLIGWSLADRMWTKPIGKPLQSSLVQGNIQQNKKWDSAYLLNILQTYRSLTDPHWHSQLIVWPEAAIPIPPQSIPQFISEIQNTAKQHGHYLLTGTIIYHPTTEKYYNAMLLLGSGSGVYLKRHLVPFGEYIPLQSVFGRVMQDFNIPMSSLSFGPKQQATLQIDHFKIAPFICYEIAFPQLVLNTTIGKQLIVVITDDSWFGRSIALAQHLQITAMSALATGRYVLLTSNSGYTAFINSLGQITAIAPINKKVVLTATVSAMHGKTPLMIWHYYPVWACVFIMLLISLLL